MADELKDQRVVTMMSPSELEAIDDWMFKSRIRSRGEAIRRLCQIGLAAEEKAKPLLDMAMAILQRRTDSSRKTTKNSESINEKNSTLAEINLALDLNKESFAALEDHSRLTLGLVNLLAPIIAMKEQDDVESALEIAQKSKQGLESLLTDLESIKANISR